MKTCIACGMPLENEQDVGIETKDGLACIHCIDENKNIKNCTEIFAGGVQFFIDSVAGTDKNFAEKIVRKNMKSLPYWQNKNEEILTGEEATDEEFQEFLLKL